MFSFVGLFYRRIELSTALVSYCYEHQNKGAFLRGGNLIDFSCCSNWPARRRRGRGEGAGFLVPPELVSRLAVQNYASYLLQPILPGVLSCVLRLV